MESTMRVLGRSGVLNMKGGEFSDLDRINIVPIFDNKARRVKSLLACGIMFAFGTRA